MARWPRSTRITVITYVAIFLGFPLLAWVLSMWVNGRG